MKPQLRRRITVVFNLACLLGPAAARADIEKIKPMLSRPGSIGRSVQYEGSFASSTATDQRLTALEYQSHRLSGRVPLSQSQAGFLALSAQLAAVQVKTNAVLDGTTANPGTKVPESFERTGLGAQFATVSPTGTTFGGQASIGTASESAFKGTAVYDGTVFFKVPTGKLADLTMYLDYSNNRSILNYKPLPGLLYTFFPEPELRIGVGFPYAELAYMSPIRLGFRAQYHYVHSALAEAVYELGDNESLILGASWRKWVFLRKERPTNRTRLFVDDDKAYVGVRAGLAPGVWIAFYGGMTLGRDVYEGTAYNRKTSLTIEAERSFYGAATVAYAF